MSDSVSGKKRSSFGTGTRRRLSGEKGVPSSEMSVCRSSAEESVSFNVSKASSIYKGSDEYLEYSCDPCSTAGDNVEAEGFCTNCEDYLCCNCFKSHSRSKTSRYHALLDKDSMPKRRLKLCDPCRIAGDEEEAAGYCVDCGEYLCNGCFRSHSRSKTSRKHVLLDKNNMSEWTDYAITSSVAKLNIYRQQASCQEINEKYTYTRNINAKAEDDENDCFIVHMTLVTRNELILADQDNESLKLVDIKSNVIKDSLRLNTFPGGLTMISQDQVAVVLDKKFKIQIISVSGRMFLVRTLTLTTNGKCVDVKCVNGKLYVSFKEPVKFQILQLTGAVHQTINLDSELLKYCTVPRHIAVSPDESMIYMSDWKSNNVMCIDMTGRMLSMYQGELDGPCDIAISPFGSVYLCNTNKDIVYKMTPDLSDVSVILGRKDGLESPQAICFNADKQHLYISSGYGDAKYCNFVKVYKWD